MVEHTLRLLLVVLCHQRARLYLVHNPDVQAFLVDALAIGRGEVIEAIGTIQMAFPLSTGFVARLRKTRFLRKYIEAASGVPHAETMVRCFELVKMLSKVAYDDGYLLLLPVFATLFSRPTGGWDAFAISLLATLSRYEEVRRAVRRQGLMALVSAVDSSEPRLLKQKAKLHRNMDAGRPG
jgi:hypothetical protein